MEACLLSVHWHALKPLDYHLDLAARLAPLRDQGVMIVASGNVVHNLKTLKWREQQLAYDWAERFDDAVLEQVTQHPDEILRILEHPDYSLAVPTPDHFIPLLYLTGLAAADKAALEPLLRSHTMGSISMTCYGLDAAMPLRQEVSCATRLPEGVPPEQSNM
ncbi:MAG TPA: class III extradiol ring-cleavage dioxygenase [Paenalcaligenes sp.]|nr:class III extradiol ring-cleavage dioxygenase [Paenalcaligenes sp.]